MRQNTAYRSRNFVLSALLSVAWLSATAFAQDATLRLDQLRPGQTHIGRANIQNIVDQNTEKTIKNNSKPENQANPKTALQIYKEKMDSGDVLPVVRAPDGTYVMLDGHHRTTSYWSIYEDAVSQWEQGNRKPDEPRPGVPTIKVNVNEDFGKKGWKEFATWMVEHKKVYFDREVLDQARRRRGVPLDRPSDEEFVRANAEFLCRNFMPRDFRAMIDSPMRSAVGTVLYDLNNLWDAQQDKAGIAKKDRKSLDGSNQLEYIEFLIGDHLKKRGIEGEIRRYLQTRKIDPPTLKGHEYDKEVLRIVEDAIFDNEEERAYLAASCRRRPSECTKEDRELVEQATAALYAIHNTKRAKSDKPRETVAPPAARLRTKQPAQRSVAGGP